MQISWVEVQVPDSTAQPGIVVSWVEVQVPGVPLAGSEVHVSWVEVETPSAFVPPLEPPCPVDLFLACDPAVAVGVLGEANGTAPTNVFNASVGAAPSQVLSDPDGCD